MRRAFTLIELLVVIVVIGVLASLVTVGLNSIRSKTRDSKRVADIRQWQAALEMYKNDNNVYPTNATSGNPLIGPDGQTYITKIPSAPGKADGSCATDTYIYSSSDAGVNYTINYCLGGAVQSAGPANCIAQPGEICAPPPHVYALRETGPGGGIVFYDKGSYSGSPSWRYLEAAPAPVSPAIDPTASWGCIGTSIDGADGIAIGDGRQNTADIIDLTPGHGCTTSGIAAKIADDLVLGGYDDWFLPSIDELVAMYTQLKLQAVGDFVNGGYWSSSEATLNTAIMYYFDDGHQNSSSKSPVYYVRAVRAF